MKTISLIFLLAVAAASAEPPSPTHVLVVQHPILLAAQEVDASLVGTWTTSGGDSGASFTIVLTLRDDGTYTKTLKANSGGLPLGGTHSGTWTSQGKVVRLSGDGNWPASSHDLSSFRKLE